MWLCKRTNTKCESPLAFVCSIFCAFSCKFSFEIQLWPHVTTTSLCSSFHIFSRKTKLVSFATASAIARRLRDFSRSWRISCLEMLLPFFLVTFADPRVHRLTVLVPPDSSSQYGISASLQPLAMSESGSPQPDAEHVVNTRDSPKTQRSTINKIR